MARASMVGMASFQELTALPGQFTGSDAGDRTVLGAITDGGGVADPEQVREPERIAAGGAAGRRRAPAGLLRITVVTKQQLVAISRATDHWRP